MMNHMGYAWLVSCTQSPPPTISYKASDMIIDSLSVYHDLQRFESGIQAVG